MDYIHWCTESHRTRTDISSLNGRVRIKSKISWKNDGWISLMLVHIRQTKSIDEAISKFFDKNIQVGYTIDVLADDGFKEHGKLCLFGYSALIFGLPIDKSLALKE